MKRIFLFLVVFVMGMVFFASCNKTQPDTSAEILTTDLFAHACNCIPQTVFGDSDADYKAWMQFWSGYLSESKDNRYGQLDTPSQCTFIGSVYQQAIGNLDKIIKMNEDPEQQKLPNVSALGSARNQIAAAKTLSAYFYMFLTDMVGPIVISDAFQGKLGESEAPAYDSQRNVFLVLDEVLNNAYSQFDASGSLYKYADLVYGGDILKWKKLNASIRMLLAIKLSDVDPATGKSRFARAYHDGGMTAASDGMDFTFGNPNKNPLFIWCSKDYAKSDKNIVPNMILVETMKNLKDPRMSAYFDIEGYKGTRDESVFPRNNYSSYYGAPFGLASPADVSAFETVVCSINKKLLGMFATVPVIPASRVLLVEAEAAMRGWISADAKTLYEAGIRASFEWWGINGANSYLSSPSIAYSFPKGLEQIATQRWIASYLSDGVEAWSDWRRLNIPEMPVGPAAIAKGIDQYPYRLGFYSDKSVTYTSASFAEAVSDLRGDDNITGRVWWDVADNPKLKLTEAQCTPPSL